MPDRLKQIFLFIAVNALGFSSSTLTFLIGLQLGRFDASSEESMTLVQDKLFMGTTITWIVCALFSVLYFVFDGRWGKIFLASAFIIPMLYGLSVIFSAAV